MKQSHIRSIGAVGALVISLIVAGCGGGGGYSAPPATNPPPVTPPPTQAGGITGTGSILKPTASSVVVNGTTFNASTATIRVDDRTGTIAEIEDGMTGKVRGRTDGTAERIEIENEVRGLVEAGSKQSTPLPERFKVNGTTVYVDSQTIYKDLANFAAIVAGSTYVEVHGLRDSSGAVRATRVQAQVQGGAGIVDEIRGTITATGTNTFTLNPAPNAVTVNYSGTTAFVPAASCSAASLTAGLVVEVHGSFTGAAFNATTIDCEDQEDSAFSPSSTDNAEVEGYVTGFTATNAEFNVGTRRVILSTTTPVRFEGGSSADLANDVRVEAEGNVNSSGVLVANKIQFKAARIILQAVPSAVNAAGGTLTVLGKPVLTTGLTKIDARSSSGNSTSLGDIQANVDCVEVRGGRIGSDIVADEVKELSSGSCDWIIRAPVDAKDATAGTLSMLGFIPPAIVVNVNSAVFRNTSDAPIDRTTFFNAITAAPNTGTVVKVKGSNQSASPLVASEAELEN